MISNDVVGGRYASNLEAHWVAKEEGAVDGAENVPPQGILAPMTGPGLTDGVVGFDANHWMRIRGCTSLNTPDCSCVVNEDCSIFKLIIAD